MQVRQEDVARRALSLVAVASLFVGLSGAISASANMPQPSTWLLASGWVAVLVLAVCVVTADSPRALSRIDVATLVVGLLLLLARFGNATSPILQRGSTDETLLNQLALKTLLAGHNPYTHSYPLVGADGFGTPLFGGGTADTYSYPPLALELGRVLGAIWAPLATVGVVEAIALVGLAIGSFVLLPQAWRPAGIIIVLGLGLETPYAIAGYPVVLAVALLCLPFYRWTATGGGGRLGAVGIGQAVCLGLAASSQQLAWPMAGFLLVGIFLVRRGELGTRGSIWVSSRYAGIAVLAFLLVNGPFVVADAAAWYRAITSLFTQHAIVFGENWTLPLLVAHHGSGNLDYLGDATALLVLALLAVFIVGFRGLAPAVAVLPSLAYALSIRSGTAYFTGFLPLWLIAISHLDVDAIRRVAPLTILPRPVLTSTARRVTVGVALFVPAVVVFTVGVFSAAPIAVRVLGAKISYGHLDSIVVGVVNRSRTVVTPTFYLDTRTAITHEWVAATAPFHVAPGGRELVILHPRTPLEPATVAPDLYLFTTQTNTMSMSATPLRLAPSQITSTRTPGDRLAREQLRCAVFVLAGHNYDCTTQLGLTSVPPQR